MSILQGLHTAKMADAGESITNRASHVRERANWMRRRLLRMIVDAGQGHPGGDLSSADIVSALYFDILRIDPRNPDAPDRDRFVLSKGHCTGALYTALAGAGFFPEAMLDTYLKPESRLNGHPNRNYLPGIEANTGPLGHGFPIGVGIAVAGQIDNDGYRVFVLTGDGELQEGSIWEAAMFAGHRGLGNLTVIVDRNRLQQGARTEETNSLEPLGDKWRAFGWEVVEVDGHDHAALLTAFDDAAEPRSKPRVLIANTFKGQGVSFMRDQAGWHHGVPNAQQYAQAIAELDAEMKR
jgi:transketolase